MRIYSQTNNRPCLMSGIRKSPFRPINSYVHRRFADKVVLTFTKFESDDKFY